MSKPPKKTNNGVEKAIDAGAHPVVASMERQHSPLDREPSAPDREHSPLDPGHSAPDRGPSALDHRQSVLDHNIASSEPSTVPSQNVVFPKTKLEARRAAKALLDAGPARHDRGSMPAVQPRSSLQKPGKSRQSLIEKSREVHAVLKRSLDQLSDHRRRFFYVDLALLAPSERSDLACFMLASRHGGLSVDGRDTTLTMITYFVDPHFLKQEPIMVRHAAALGWQVTRRRVETPGHAVELLTRRIQALGWA